jgi:hypothetical protein
MNNMNKEQQKKAIASIIESGELDLGFCKLLLKPVSGGRGKSHGTNFKIGKFYKLGVIMSKELKALINK